MKMTKLQSFNEILPEFFDLEGMTIIDIGCAKGDLVRWMTLRGASVTGIDLPEMIAQAKKIIKTNNEKYIVGTAQDFPFEENTADLIVYLASFHHVPEGEMKKALENCFKVLKPGAHAVFIEPVAGKGTYYELVRLVEDEQEIQKKAYEYLKEAGKTKFMQVNESYYYVDRSFQDFLDLIEIFVTDKNQRESIIERAKEVILAKNGTIDQVRYKSEVRLNLLRKIN